MVGGDEKTSKKAGRRPKSGRGTKNEIFKESRQKYKSVGKILTDKVFQVIDVVDPGDMTLPIICRFIVTIPVAWDLKWVTSKEGTLSNVTNVGVISSQVTITDTPKNNDIKIATNK